MLDIKAIASVTLILFSVIDILGSLPVIIELRAKTGHVESEKASLVATLLLIAFLYLGESILSLFGLDVSSFAVAGAIVIFFIGLEMVLGIRFFRHEPHATSASIVPIAFPLIAGAGSLTTIISLRAEYSHWNILVGIVVNMVFVYIVLKSSGWLQRKLGTEGANILRNVFGIILLAIAVKLLKTNLFGGV
jgi:multiple antibiotic resistance protein